MSGDGSIEAFDLLSNEVRLDILRTLGEAMAADESPLAFTELQQRVGVEDNGRFNYHLTRLVGRLVDKEEDGYELKPPGNNIYRAIVSGAYTDDGGIDPVPVEGETCPYCGADAAAWYEDSHFHLGCSECDNLVIRYPIPPASFDRDRPESLLAAGGAFILRDQTAMRQGVCPYCAGEVSGRLTEEGGELEEFNERIYSSVARFVCGRCSWSMHCGVPFALNIEPAVVSFFHDHGIAIFDRHPWSIYQYADDRVCSRDPWRVEVTCRIDDDLLRVVIDENVDVIETEVESAT
ncbi:MULTISPECIES: winged helix-turn-helix domain-containing protein [Halolamina]|uniref:Helix-turn-helix domain-containing protein n=1 Tax=Halolamina pelagica TaxID=699431 RepID=A0A1I5M656_9EURY|nr:MULTISPECIES: helix-turn-helix domain-containing protein [Halolamina]NHX35882.1 helix-turn-helix transcriptional regulator [Halolamina sp. R1-12]SFP05019.1 Helix-turn-helix domain-containing protein [Halolamina pelagica]